MMKIYTEEEWRHYITMRYMVGDEKIKHLVLQDGVYQWLGGKECLRKRM